jgi:GGDEF domain-containing protein
LKRKTVENCQNIISDIDHQYSNGGGAGVEKLEGKFPDSRGAEFGRILSRGFFLFLLDLEVKRARRYQNFLCLMLLKIKQFSQEGNGGGLQACYRTLSNLLMEEIRESDIIGSLDLNQLVVLLPYADAKAGDYFKSRFEDALKYYEFGNRGFEITIDQVCFPVHGTNAMDLIKKALGTEPT